jgi:hypothetical protein
MVVMTHPRVIIDRSAMTRLQVIVTAMTVGLNALDGFDILSISFASPGIAAEWGIPPPALGIVLSMELIGMGFGSLLLGGFADLADRHRLRHRWDVVVDQRAGGRILKQTATAARVLMRMAKRSEQEIRLGRPPARIGRIGRLAVAAEMLENPFDDGWILDAGNDLELPATTTAHLDVDRKDTLEA